MTGHYLDAVSGTAANTAAPSSVLLRLLDSDRYRLHSTVMWRKNLPQDVIEAVLGHADPAVRNAFAESWNVPPEQRARLLDDPRSRNVLAVATGPLPNRTKVEPLPDWAYERLLSHPRDRVRHETLMSPAIPAHIVAGLADHPEPAFRVVACRAWDQLGDETRQSLLDDEHYDVWRAASLRVCHQDEERTTELIRQEGPDWQLVQPLKHGLLSRAVAEWMVAEERHLAALAHNPSLPSDLVARLATDPDPDVRLAVSARPELTEDERAAVKYAVGPDDRLPTLDWVWDARADSGVLRRCATSAHTWLRRSAAVCPGLPPDLVQLLADDDDFAVRLMLAEFHPEPPPELLLDLYLHGAHQAVGMLIVNPRFPRAGLAARFGDSEHARCRELAMRDPEATPELIERLSRDTDPSVRGTAARDPRLSLARVRELLAEPETAYYAAANPTLPVDDMHAVLDEAGIGIRI
ncbi:hypothetical protein ACIHCQ_27940 [Streptomyces sp. NPDC052236]|uniref:hypothetical protein n=1 Tax=Streptomyces sp. NPDC052236 TaxID=3365686 RepID=UPI0037CF60B1